MELQDDGDLRQRALKQLKKKRDFAAHLFSYVVINAFVIAIWFLTSDGGFFWPVFVIGGWGIGVLFNAWDVYYGGPTEDDITKEMNRLARHGR